MKRSILKLLTVSALFAYAGTASAFIDADVMVGKRWYQLQSTPQHQNLASQEVSLAAHLDPIPLVPVSFGLRLDYDSINPGDTGLTSVSQATVIRPGIDVTAWVPGVPVLTPYVRVELPVGAKMVMKSSTVDNEGDVTGANVAIGAKFSLIPVLLHLMVELDRSIEQYQQTTLTLNSAPLAKSTSPLIGNAFLVGLQVGF